ncbi:hypothetical protein CC80DRAFT_544018 [Byssothecium circinans]|uniref:Uncharacterized protein n=1 Tax=Byssothecium circinans TaxID=147558 RepID=A0A6A5U7C9_9PLEO|nr:hypothetical protein CC80DRAFT_544018 [Byssothecium circinans]
MACQLTAPPPKASFLITRHLSPTLGPMTSETLERAETYSQFPEHLRPSPEPTISEEHHSPAKCGQCGHDATLQHTTHPWIRHPNQSLKNDLKLSFQAALIYRDWEKREIQKKKQREEFLKTAAGQLKQQEKQSRLRYSLSFTDTSTSGSFYNQSNIDTSETSASPSLGGTGTCSRSSTDTSLSSSSSKKSSRLRSFRRLRDYI